MQEETEATQASVEAPGASAPSAEVQESTPEVTPVVAESGNVEAASESPDDVSAEVPSVAATEVPAEVVPEVPEPATTESPSDVSSEAPAEVSAETPSDGSAESVEAPAESAAASAEPTSAEPTSAEPTTAEPVVEVATIVFTYQPGDIVPGIITVIGPNGIEADLGEGEMAVIPKAELVDDHEPVVGEHIEGTVVRHQAGSGRYVISRSTLTAPVRGLASRRRSKPVSRSPAS